MGKSCGARFRLHAWSLLAPCLKLAADLARCALEGRTGVTSQPLLVLATLMWSQLGWAVSDFSAVIPHSSQ